MNLIIAAAYRRVLFNSMVEHLSSKSLVVEWISTPCVHLSVPLNTRLCQNEQFLSIFDRKRVSTNLVLVLAQMLYSIVLSSRCCNCMFDLRSYFWWCCFSIISIHSLVISVVVSLFVVAKFAVPMRATLLRNLPQVQQVAAGGSFCVALTGK